jgi:hypothetical protein
LPASPSSSTTATFPDVDAETLDPFFSSAPLKRLLHLLINAILYATSAGVESELRSPPASAPRRGRPEEPFSSEEVYYLPGKIDISQLRQVQTLQRISRGRKLMHRFMVRGHWRRPNPAWKDQRPRWIQPYWKGPDIAAVIERAYRMKT